jgi:transposase
MAKSHKKQATKAQNNLPILRSNAAGIDIGATEIFVAVPPDRAAQNVRSFPTFTQDLYRLAQWLKDCGVETVAMESTGVYWIPLFQILEDAGFEVFLVNARHVRSVPGRKSDVCDCQWLQFLHSVGLLKASFRPAQDVCAIRSLLRHRKNLVEMASSHIQHMQKAMNQMNLQIHHVISDITGKTGLDIIDAILRGERNPHALAKLRDRRIKASEDVIAKSLVGDYRPEHLFTLQQSLAAYRYYEKLIHDCESEISRALKEFNGPDSDARNDGGEGCKRPGDCEPFSDGLLQRELKRAFGVDLVAVTGVNVATIQMLFGEIGPDFTKFSSASAFASWLTLCPNNDVSGGKVLASKTRRSKSRATTALRMAVQSLHHSKSFLGEFYRRMRAKFGPPKAITATAHKLARIIFHLVTSGQEFDESRLVADHTHYHQRQEARLRSKARALGFVLVPVEPTLAST